MFEDDDNELSEFNEYIQPDLFSENEVGDFFQDNLIKTRTSIPDKSYHKFVGLESNGARVAFILGYHAAHELPVEVDDYELKDPPGFRFHKKHGNEAFGVGHYPVAIEDYNNAVLLAPKEELGVLLANRAAAFYHLEKFRLALSDCEEAIKIGYPKHLMYKLEERRARCFLGLKCHIKAIEAFKNALRALDDADLASEKKAKLESDIRLMLAVMDKGHKLTQKEHGVTMEKLLEMENQSLKDKDMAPRIKDLNPAYPALSKAVEIRDAGGDVGRYAVATRDVQPGEILAVEKPHCITLLEEHRKTHCFRCTMRVVAPLPASCYKCSAITYCSPRCRDADEQLHRLECGILGILWCSKASVTCFLALRAIIQRPYEEFLKIKQNKLELGKEPYSGKNYKTFHNLVTHEDERTAEDLFHRAYIAAWLLRILKSTSYLPNNVKTPDNAEIPLSKGEIIIADAILHHLQLLQFNSHEISEFIRAEKRPDLSQGKSIFVGGGVYPSVALFNHSCNPGVSRYFVNNTMVVKAIKSIPAGTEISENYGPIFTENEENDRKRQLRLQYWFDCGCEACKDHWPTLDKIDPTLLRFKCETGPSCGNILLVNVNTEMFMIPCSKCGASTNIFKGLKALQDTESLYKTGTKYSAAGNHEEALKSYLTVLKVLDDTLALPLKDYHLCQQGIRQCMLAQGNSSIISPKIRR